MMNKNLDAEYWENKYLNKDTGWDIGYASPPITSYINQLKNKDISILIPGAGNGHEVVYIFENGFKNISVVDLAKKPLAQIHNKLPNLHTQRLINGDFFDHQQTYDLIIEQTFFCALNPKLREAYAKKMFELLNPGGKLVGVLFDFPLTDEGPPFGGSLKEYQKLFSPYFKINTLERAYNSIKPRQGSELFINFEKE